MRLALASCLLFVACKPLSAEAPADHTQLERENLLASLARGETNDVVVILSDGPARDATLIEGATYAAENLPVMSVQLRSTEALAALEQRPGVLAVEPVRRFELNDTSSFAAINQPAALARGADGKNVAIAIVDTGADYTHADLGACTAPGGSCPVAFAKDFATEDNLRDGSVPHGTNVSAIAHGVAPAAKILALDVFDGQYATTLSLLAAVDWIIAQRATYNIVAANFSLGYGAFTAACPNDSLAIAMGKLRAAGVIPVVASGNDGATNAISSPACAPAAVSVGAVDNTSTVASFSNSASFLSVLAPGVYVRGGGVIMSGTSQATPHVAGSLAVLRSYYAAEGVDGAVDRLKRTGTNVTDARNNLVFKRIDLGAATGGTIDTKPPTGTITLSARYVKTPTVDYVLTGTDASGIAQMCLSFTTTCTAFVPYVGSGTVQLPAGDGSKVLRAWLRDPIGNTMAQPIGATVTLDTVAPKDGKVTVRSGLGRVELSFASFSDATSGIARYRVVYATDAVPATCDAGTLAGETTTTSFVHAAVTNGTTYRYRVCAIDKASNVSTGVVVSATAVPETQPPTGSITVDAWSKSTLVTVSISAQDASGVASMCVTSATKCSAWIDYATTAIVSVSAGSGSRTVRAWFRDVWGNETKSPVSATFKIDTQAPSSPRVVATVAPASVTLSFKDVKDASGGSGVAGYWVATATGSIPETCAGGRQIVFGSSSPYVVVLQTSALIGYRVCAVDKVGNVSAGTTGTSALVAGAH